MTIWAASSPSPSFGWGCRSGSATGSASAGGSSGRGGSGNWLVKSWVATITTALLIKSTKRSSEEYIGLFICLLSLLRDDMTLSFLLGIFALSQASSVASTNWHVLCKERNAACCKPLSSHPKAIGTTAVPGASTGPSVPAWDQLR